MVRPINVFKQPSYIGFFSECKPDIYFIIQFINPQEMEAKVLEEPTQKVSSSKYLSNFSLPTKNELVR